MKDKLAVFDLDGTLFDTKDVNYKAYDHAFKECGYNVNLDYKYYCKFCNGNSYKTFLPKVIEGILQNDMERIHKSKKNAYPLYLDYARENSKLFKIISLIKNEYTIALVTTASKKNTMDILKKFGKTETFDFVLTGEDVLNHKPNPECFNLAIKRAGVTKENTLIFEDSDVGLAAAKASGADYIQVYGYN